MDHIDILSKLYPKQVLERFVYELEKMASKKGSRSDYKKIADYLIIMKKINGGDLVVRMLIAKWSNEYEDRRVFLEDVRKAIF